MNSSFEDDVIQGKNQAHVPSVEDFMLQVAVEYLPGRVVNVPLSPYLSYEQAQASLQHIQSRPVDLSGVSLRRTVIL
jgi:hypothetical protein